MQSGFGRTGKMFAVDHYDIEPDIICMAKGIASGFPFSALGTRRELDDQWPKGSHGGTYGGNPIGCAAALATIEVMSEPGFLDNVRARGEQLSDAPARAPVDSIPSLRQVRGPGLDGGQQLRRPGSRAGECIEPLPREGHLILMNAGTYGNVIRWMPPLVVSADEIDEGVQAFSIGPQGHRLSDAAVPRLDAASARWRGLQSIVPPRSTRRIDVDLMAEWDIPLGWFDVLAALQRLGGRARPLDVAAEMRLPPSSLSRRLDRLEEEGWVRAPPRRRSRRPSCRRGRADPPRAQPVAGDERHLPAVAAAPFRGPRLADARRLRPVHRVVDRLAEPDVSRARRHEAELDAQSRSAYIASISAA